MEVKPSSPEWRSVDCERVTTHFCQTNEHERLMSAYISPSQTLTLTLNHRETGQNNLQLISTLLLKLNMRDATLTVKTETQPERPTEGECAISKPRLSVNMEVLGGD